MDIAVDSRFSLEVFGGSADHDFFKNNPSLIASQPLISCAAADA
jgi:hypothetical protein